MKLITSALIWLLVLPALCSFSSCSKNEPFPSGSNLFTCKVMGETFIPKSDDFKREAKRASIRNDTLAISGTYNIGKYESVGFRVENFSGVGTYKLNTSQGTYGRYIIETVLANTNHQYTGEVTVTHYIPEKRIIAGTFFFTAHEPASGKTYQITDGKFDMLYAHFE